MRRLCGFMLGIMLVLAANAQHEKGIERIRAALAKDKPYRAIGLSQRILLKKDTPDVVLLLRADAYNRIGNYRAGLHEASKAARSIPDDVEVRSQLMAAYLGLGEPDSAAAHILAGAGLQNESYLLRKGLAHLQLKEYDLALSSLDEGVGAFPRSKELVRERGACHALMGDSAKARVDLDKAVQLAPRDPVSYNHRGYYRYALFGEHAKAIADMDRAIKLDPNYGYAFSNRGWSRYKLGDTSKSVRDLHLAARKNPGNSYVFLYLGRIDLDAGNTGAACAHFHTALGRGFTRYHGNEVQDLIDANCASRTPSSVPVDGPIQPPPSNAPGSAPPKSNAP